MKLKCALCMWVHFTDVERDYPTPQEVMSADTIVNGTALCNGHLEDWDQDDALRRKAGQIVGPADCIDMKLVQTLGDPIDTAATGFVEAVYAKVIAYVSAFTKQHHTQFRGAIVLNTQDAQVVVDESLSRGRRPGDLMELFNVRPGLCGTLFGIKLWADDSQPVGSVGVTTYVW